MGGRPVHTSLVLRTRHQHFSPTSVESGLPERGGRPSADPRTKVKPSLCDDATNCDLNEIRTTHLMSFVGLSTSSEFRSPCTGGSLRVLGHLPTRTSPVGPDLRGPNVDSPSWDQRRRSFSYHSPLGLVQPPTTRHVSPKVGTTVQEESRL